jgi:hypothetical protein
VASKFNFANAEERRLFLDPWEKLATLDPYFFSSTHRQPDGTYANRGWIDPSVDYAARHLSRSAKFVLRADWAIPRLLLEKDFGGIYSDLLMFPKQEKDLFKALLIDIDAVNRDGQLRQGGAVLESIVALHNRELQLIPSAYGQGGNRYAWLTFDTNIDARGDKSVLEAFAGTVKHDGRESIGTLPNNLLWYQLFDGKGAQASSVPDNIAQIHSKQDVIRETRVINSYSCIKCHGPTNGIVPFDDVVRKTFLNPAANLVTKGYDPHKADDEAATLADYYASTLPETIRTQQASYAITLKAACDMTGVEVAKAVPVAVESFSADLVTPEMASRELGYPIDPVSDPYGVMRAYVTLQWLAGSVDHTVAGVHYKGNPVLAVLASGQAIRRSSWEDRTFADAARVVVYPWEKQAAPATHKGP